MSDPFNLTNTFFIPKKPDSLEEMLSLTNHQAVT